MMNDNSLDTEEAQLFAAVHGVTPSGASPDELGAQLHSMRQELCQPPDAQARWNHLAAMRRATSVSPPHRRFRGVVAIVAATAGLVTVTTGLAAADRLPRSAQDQVAKFAEVVGVDLPGNDHAPAASTPKPTAGLDDATQGTAPPVGAVRRNPSATTTIGGEIDTPSNRGSGPASGESPSATAPGQTGHTPSGTGSTPGDTVTPPGQDGSAPGSSENAPGHDGTAPGNSENAPGHDGTAPGNSENAPGHVKDASGQSGMAPGHIGSAGKSASAVSKLPAPTIASVTDVPDTDVSTP